MREYFQWYLYSTIHCYSAVYKLWVRGGPSILVKEKLDGLTWHSLSRCHVNKFPLFIVYPCDLVPLQQVTLGSWPLSEALHQMSGPLYWQLQIHIASDVMALWANSPFLVLNSGTLVLSTADSNCKRCRCYPLGCLDQLSISCVEYQNYRTVDCGFKLQVMSVLSTWPSGPTLHFLC